MFIKRQFTGTIVDITKTVYVISPLRLNSTTSSVIMKLFPTSYAFSG